MLERPCCFEPFKDSPDGKARQERARRCRCNPCVEARSFVALRVTHSVRPEITARIAALLWRAPTPA
jgi:hypothetical protein